MDISDQVVIFEIFRYELCFFFRILITFDIYECKVEVLH